MSKVPTTDEGRAILPPCFSPRLLVCPKCLYIGSARPEFSTGFCWACTAPLDDSNVHIFGPEKDEATK